ncbi:MAG: molybdopterin-dependent oxidoreductase [Pseudomonadota bacterium]
MEGKRKVNSTCLGCIGNCGAIYEVENNKILKVKGDPDHPLTKGYMCPKGMAVEEIRSAPDRLKHPLKRIGNKGEGKWDQISWEDAISEIAERLSRVKEKYGAEAVVIADGFAGVLSGLDPVVGKFAHSFGTPNRLVDLHN